MAVREDARQLDDFGEPPAVVLSFDIDFQGDQGLTDSESVYDERNGQADAAASARRVSRPNHVGQRRGPQLAQDRSS